MSDHSQLSAGLRPRLRQRRRADGDPAAPAGGGACSPRRRRCRSKSSVARADTVVDAIIATGQIEATASIELRPEVDGRLAEILVREGSLVAGARRSSRWTTRSSRRRSPGPRRSATCAPGARPDPRPARREGREPGRPRARRSADAEHPGRARAAPGPARPHDRARAVRRGRGRAHGERRRLRTPARHS